MIAGAVWATTALMFAVSAQARWLGVVNVGESSSGAPAIAFDPAGNAALAFGHNSGVDLVARHKGGAFGAARFLPANQDKGNLPGGLVLPKPGEAVLLVTYDQPYGPVEPWQGLVRPAGSASFRPPQPLGISNYHYQACCGSLLGDARGETIGEFSNPYNYRSFIRVLAPGASRFGPRQRMPSTLAGLVADGAGGLFDDWCRGACNPTSDVMVGYRPFGGTFSHGVRVACRCGGSYGEVVAAGGRGHVALVWFRQHHLHAALGGPNGVSSGRVVARAGRVFDIQVVVTARGSPVVAWEDCSRRPCRLRIAFGNVHGRFTRPQTLGTLSTVTTMAGDARGHLIIAWHNGGSVRAVACHAKAQTCGPSTVLSTGAASAGYPAVAFGPRGEAIVAWSRGYSGSSAEQPVFADVYQLSRS